MDPSMSICVAGWYFDKFDEFYASLHRLNKDYPVHVVCNRQSEYLNIIDLPYSIRANKGLEWGAYNFYLMNLWNQKSSVLFCHDDIILNPVVVNGEVRPPEWIFSKIAECPVDQAYIFSSRAEDVENYGQHGRMIFMSANFLTKCLETGGFWYDGLNGGHTSEEDKELREKFKCLGYNAGIISFHSQAKAIGGNVHRKIFIPSFDLAKRGEPTQKALNYGIWLDKVYATINDLEMKLNVGCGDDYLDGYVNVDKFNEKADYQWDAKKLECENDRFRLVEAHHLIEHFSQKDARIVLDEFYRVLMPGGYLFISTPDIVAIIDALRNADGQPDYWDAIVDIVYRSSREHEKGQAHKFAYSQKSLTHFIEKSGFVNVEVKNVIGLRPTPSLLAFAKKPIN